EDQPHHRLADPPVGVRLLQRGEQPQPIQDPSGQRVQRVRDPHHPAGRPLDPEPLHHHADRQIQRGQRERVAGDDLEEALRIHGALAARFLSAGSSFFTRGMSGDFGASRVKFTYSSYARFASVSPPAAYASASARRVGPSEGSSCTALISSSRALVSSRSLRRTSPSASAAPEKNG